LKNRVNIVLAAKLGSLAEKSYRYITSNWDWILSVYCSWQRGILLLILYNGHKKRACTFGDALQSI